MRITDIEVINLHFEYPEERRFHYAGGVCTGRLTSLVKVHTDSGLVGLGSVYSHPGLVRAIIEGHLRPVLIGEDPLDTERLWNRCYALTRWYGRKGVAVSAIGGIDIALWDLKGKAAGRPICRLDGMRLSRDRVPAYASGLLWKEDVRELREEASRHLSEGHVAMKMRLGRDPAYDVNALRAVREAIGSEPRLMVDANARYTLGEAALMIPRLEEAGVYWLEEPFGPDSVATFVSLQSGRGTVLLAAGENEFGVPGFLELMHRGAVQVIQPDCSRCGGFTEARRIASSADVFGMEVAPHTWSDAVALAANIHLVATTPHALTVEVDRTGNPFVDDLLTQRLEVKNGFIDVPTAPGLGVELDEDVVARHALPRDGPVPPGNYSDMVFR